MISYFVFLPKMTVFSQERKYFTHIPGFTPYPRSQFYSDIRFDNAFDIKLWNTLQMFTGIYGVFAGKSECRDFRIAGLHK
jgi:hypothetical protein